MNKTHLVMALLLIGGKSDFQPIISCSITKPKECFTLPHKVFSLSTSIQGKADSTYKDMDDWLGERFLQEVER